MLEAARALPAAARASLVAAWADYYGGSLEWAIIKSWHAASTATLQADPLGGAPISYRLLTQECPELSRGGGPARHPLQASWRRVAPPHPGPRGGPREEARPRRDNLGPQAPRRRPRVPAPASAPEGAAPASRLGRARDPPRPNPDSG